MRVVCDNCRAVYKIPDDKLVKPVNKATCRSCGHRMLIPRPAGPTDEEERTLIKDSPRIGGLPVTTQPPTAGDRVTTPMESEEAEQTLPRVIPPKHLPENPAPVPFETSDDIPLLATTPMPARSRNFGPAIGDGEEATQWVPNPPQAPPRQLEFEPRHAGPAAPPRPSASGPARPSATKPPSPRPIVPLAQPAHAPPSAPAPSTPPSAAPRVVPSTPSPAPARPVIGAASPVADKKGTTPQPAPRRPAASPPAGRSSTPGVETAHDPAGDMGLVFLGALGGLLGILVLGIDIQTSSLVLDTIIRVLSLLVSLGGIFTSMLVLVTGARGRQPAQRVISILGGGVIAVLLAAVLTAAQAGISYLTSGTAGRPTGAGPSIAAATHGGDDAVADADTEVDAGTESPEPPQTRPPSTAPKTSTSPASSTPPRASTPPRTTSAASSDPPRTSGGTSSSGRSTSSSSTSSSSSGRSVRVTPVTSSTSTASTPPPASDPFGAEDDDALLLDDEPPPSTSSSRSTSSSTTTASSPTSADDAAAADAIPMEALDVMLRSNLAIKKCFFTHMQSEGSLPPRVDVKFTLESNGRVSKCGITQTAYAGTELDFCLAEAIKSITFPPSSASTKITYPFIFE